MLATAGFENDQAYFANVFTATRNESLSAAGFYAVGVNTEYEVYVISEFSGVESLSGGKKVAEGVLSNEGYYTIDFNEEIGVTEGTRFAVVVQNKNARK